MGSFSDNGQGTVTVAAGGTDIWGTADQFRYAYAQMIGNGSITARITSQGNTNGWAKAGVMLRETLDANARNAALLVSPSNGVTFQRRDTAGGSSVNTTTAGITAPMWLKLTRSGTIFAARSSDGVTWTTVGSAAVAFPSTPIYVGLAVTSHNTAATSTATFTNVSMTGNVRTTASPVYARGYVYGSYVDELLAILSASGVVGDRKFVHGNNLYSLAALTDNSGNVVERYRYDAYGQRTVLAADGTTVRAASSYGNQYGFTARFHDRESGLTYFRTRYESPTLGRFINRMPWTTVVTSEEQGYLVPYSFDDIGVPWTPLIVSGLRTANGTYFQDRYNHYDFMKSSPSNGVEPFSHYIPAWGMQHLIDQARRPRSDVEDMIAAAYSCYFDCVWNETTCCVVGAVSATFALTNSGIIPKPPGTPGLRIPGVSPNTSVLSYISHWLNGQSGKVAECTAKALRAFSNSLKGMNDGTLRLPRVLRPATAAGVGFLMTAGAISMTCSIKCL